MESVGQEIYNISHSGSKGIDVPSIAKLYPPVDMIVLDMDNVTAVQCVQRQDTVRSGPLLALSEDIAEASHRSISLSAKYVPGRENDWADALSRFWGTSVEWQRPPTSTIIVSDYSKLFT